MGTPHEPRFWRSDYIHLRALRAQLARAIADNLSGRDHVDVIDVACGDQPYRSLFPSVGRYVGVDLADGPHTDVVAAAESLPFEDESFDAYLCNQMLQYSPEPAAVVAEAHRVLRPGGVAMISTHGLALQQTLDTDRWRWTHTGLETLLADAAPWAKLDIHPNGGAASGAAYVGGIQMELLAKQLSPSRDPRVAEVAAGTLIAVVNAVAWNMDRYVRRAYPDRPPVAAPNYLAVARRS